MKKFSLVIVVSLLALTFGSVAFADATIQFRASKLEKTLMSLQEAALTDADTAFTQNQLAQGGALDEFSDLAGYLALETHRGVFRGSLLGDSKYQSRLSFKQLESTFDHLDQKYAGFFHKSYALQAAYNQYLTARDALDDSLAPSPGPGPGPGFFSPVASCTGTFGGNFFQKLTHVKCNLSGKWAKSYEVVYNGNVIVVGSLNPQAHQQSFNTSNDKRAVGKWAQYKVYVIGGKFGTKKVLVAQGQASGNPW